MVRVARATPDTTASWQIPSTSYLGDILVASLKKDLSRSLYELQHFEDFEKMPFQILRKLRKISI